MKAILNIMSLTAGNKKVVVPFKEGRLLMGRGSGELILEDQYSSRKHCALYSTQKGEFLLLDLGSRNGTRLNGKKVRCEKIAIGDEIVIGETRLILVEVVSDSAQLGVSPMPRISNADTVRFTLKLKQPPARAEIVLGSDALYTCCSEEQKEYLSAQGLIKK